MTSSKRKRKPSSSLLSGTNRPRPTSTSGATTSSNSAKPLPSKLSRKLIRAHHTTQKRLSQALAKNDAVAVSSLQSELESSGGLEAYQIASISGQNRKRGGDSSRLLTEWFAELGIPKPLPPRDSKSGDYSFRLLEIGCLSPHNDIHAFFPDKSDKTLIDLNSQHPEISKQDFMTLPLPGQVEEAYDLVSCSLVLNYVPTPTGRGEMLRKITEFMKLALEKNKNAIDDVPGWKGLFPLLFLVLPAPCVTNSRYLTEERLADIMGSLGYKIVKRKLSPKLVYELWQYVGGKVESKPFKKIELLKGGKRNNFAIVLG